MELRQAQTMKRTFLEGINSFGKEVVVRKTKNHLGENANEIV